MTDHLRSLGETFDVMTVFIVSDLSRTYYDMNGAFPIQDNDPDAMWYFDFVKSDSIRDINVTVNSDMHNTPMVFINYRMNDIDGGLLGVTGVGLALESIPDIVERLGTETRQSVTFTGSDGRIITRSKNTILDVANLYDIKDTREMFDRFFNGERSFFELEYRGETILVGACEIPELDWYMFVEQSEKIALERIYGLLIAIAVVYLVALIATLLLIQLTVRFFNRRLEMMATTDQLTGISSRLVFEHSLSQALLRLDRNDKNFTILLIDLDHFKRINDTFGHLKGDEILRRIAAIFGERIRSSDEVCRWGGEEFAALLEKCTLDQGAELAEELRRAVEESDLLQFSDGSSLTISVGVTEIVRGDSADSVIGRVDTALYRAKRDGRNCVRTRVVDSEE